MSSTGLVMSSEPCQTVYYEYRIKFFIKCGRLIRNVRETCCRHRINPWKSIVCEGEI